jgi:hypothetical protein
VKRALKWLGIGLGVLVALVGLLFVLAITGVLGPPTASPEAIASSVQRDEALLTRAFELPVAKSYGRELEWQTNGSTCGPASVANALRSFDGEPHSEDAVLEGTGLCQTGMCFMGLTLDQLAFVAEQKTDRRVVVRRDLSPEQFREELILSNDPYRRVIINFSRKPIFGAGGGHHSPIGGYLEKEDLVLVLDVNEVYQPWLVERERLYEAMDTLDGEHKRGLLIIE